MINKLNILLFEDPVNGTGAIGRALSNAHIEFNILLQPEQPGYHAVLETSAPDVVIANCAAPGSFGHQVLAALQGRQRHAAFICICDPEFEAEALNLLKNGAADYLISDRLMRLPFAILNIIEKYELHIQKEHRHQALHYERRRTTELLMKVPSAVCILTGPDHVFHFANLLYHQLTGSDNLLNKKLKEVFTRPEHQFIVAVVGQVYQTGETFIDSEVCIPVSHKDTPTELYINFVVQALRNNTGAIEGVMVFGIDVTGQVQARKEIERVNQEISQAEAILNEAQKLAQIGNWNYDLVKQQLSWSDGLKEIYWGDESLIPANQYFENLIHPEDKIRVEYEVDELKRIGKNMKTRFRIMNEAGEVKVLNGENRIETDEAGQPIRLYGILQDITAMKAAEETLKKSEANLRTLLNHTDAAHILVDHNLKIIAYSQKAEEIAEFRGHTNPLEGSDILDYFAIEKIPRLKKIIEEVMNGKDISYETNVLEKGTEKWYTMKWIAVNDSEHNYWGFILSVKDITEQKNLAKQQNRMTSELISRNKDLEQFTYVVSHNLRAPVANIIGLSELLDCMQLEQSGATELTTALCVSIKNLDTVISDLNEVLKMKKESSGKAKEQIDIQLMVDDIKSSINHLIVKEDVTFEYHIEQAYVQSIRGYLHSIFYNLILNSIKYRLPNLTPRLIIRSYIEDAHLNLIFEDNGKGIDLDKHGSQLFGLYKRFDDEVSGKGMGLFMVKNQVEELGGTIQARSAPGKGTLFHIVLPEG